MNVEAAQVEIELRDGGVYIAGTRERVYCQWFARCPHPASTTVAHPVLGDVPTCARCATLAR